MKTGTTSNIAFDTLSSYSCGKNCVTTLPIVLHDLKTASYLEVGSGAENSRCGALQDDHADPSVKLDSLNGTNQLENQVFAERIFGLKFKKLTIGSFSENNGKVSDYQITFSHLSFWFYRTAVVVSLPKCVLLSIAYNIYGVF